LKAIPPFDNWPNFGIMLIFNNCEELEYSISNFIYKEDDPSSYVYFIKEGEVEVTKVNQYNTTLMLNIPLIS